MEQVMKICLYLALLVVAAYGQHGKRQFWRDGLWGRELQQAKANSKDVAEVSDLLKDTAETSVGPYHSEVSTSQTQQARRLNLRDEVEDSQTPLPQMVGLGRSKFQFLRLRYPNQKQQSQQN